MSLIKYYRVMTNREDGNYANYNGRNAVLIELEENHSGVFVIEVPGDAFCKWHRIMTSPIKTISLENNDIVVQTQNTKYTFISEEREDNE